MKREDIIGLGLAYLGVIVILLFIFLFNWIPTNLDGLFNNQVEKIIEVCVNGAGGGSICP